MARQDTPYILELTEEEFHELRSIVHTCDYFHQINVKYNHVQHLERLFQEAERDVNDYCMQEARKLVSDYYNALQRIQSESKYSSCEAFIQRPTIYLTAHEATLKNKRACEFLTQNIPDGTVQWNIIPDYRIEETLINPTRVSVTFNYIPNLFNNEEEPKKKLGFFEK